MKQLVIFLLFTPLLGICQIKNDNDDSLSTGIHFEQKLRWKEVLAKAKEQNKYIFLDCYATWCLPCKKMDMYVYPNDTLGEIINPKFISVKVQIDTSKNDNDRIKNWYLDANKIKNEYEMKALPTYLFYSPDGELIHEDFGVKSVKEFSSLIEDVLTPDKQYFTLLKKYYRREVNFQSMLYLERLARKYQQTDIADEIATNYMRNYLEKIDENAFLLKENITTMGSFYDIINSGDRIFKFCYFQSDKIDKIVEREGFSQSIVDLVITKEEILPMLNAWNKANHSPEWLKLNKKITDKYNFEYAKRNIINVKVDYYRDIKDWKNYSKFLVQKTEQDDLSKLSRDFWGANYLNGIVWDIFLYSNNPIELKKAISWCEYSIQIAPFDMKPGLLDTKANILYKLGKKNEALIIENVAFTMDSNNKDIRATYEKMKKGKATWNLD